ncbi:cytochrome c [Arenimonas sp.]|uniref:cytochrome c n=1 Tax=Arenimonas sp. TaxID=1872635 RepID=UPI0039E44A4D
MKGGMSTTIALLLLTACSGEPAPTTTSTALDESTKSPALVKGDPVEGLRVATRVGCNGCHGEHGGGEALWSEPGEFSLVAPNLTEKRELYDDAGLERLLRHGQTHDGHVPFGMPVKMFQHLSDREVRDIAAWLRSLPEAANPTLENSWFSDDIAKQIKDGTHPYSEDMQPDPGNLPPGEPPTETLALGRHLAMTSCGECHGWDLNGFEGDDAPSLIVAKAYSAENFSRLMRTGLTASGKESKTGLMSGVARWRFKPMSDAEIAALKAYLDSR